MSCLPRNVGLFESFSELERADLTHFMHEREFAAGETVYTRGEHGNTMLVVLQGALSAVVPGKNHRPHEISHLGPGAVLGEMFCIDPAPRPVTIVAKETTSALELGRDDLVKMRQEAPQSAAALVSAVFHEVLRRLRSVDNRVEREIVDGSRRSKPAEAGSPEKSDTPGPWKTSLSHPRGSA